MVYCDLFEHLILHTLIIQETEAEYGLSGYEVYLYPMAKEWIQKNVNPKSEWMKKCKRRASLIQKDAEELLNKISEFTRPFKEARLAILKLDFEKRVKQRNTTKRNTTVSEYEKYLVQEEKKSDLCRAVSKCLDNQPIESFWGTLKAERYYLNKYLAREELISDLEEYIHFYNHERITLKHNGLTLIEIRNKAIA